MRILLGLFLVGTAWATPQIGDRAYVGAADPYKMVEVVSIKELETKDFILDPSLRQEKKKANKVREVKKTKKITKSYEPKRLKFAPVAIRGRLAKPRIAFSRDKLPVGRADRALKYDFYERLFEPVEKGL